MERHWAEVISCSYQFDMRELEVLQLQTVSQEEVCEWLHRYTHPGESYRKLSVKVSSLLVFKNNFVNSKFIVKLKHPEMSRNTVVVAGHLLSCGVKCPRTFIGLCCL